jgi:hypothetical protein
VTPTIVERGAIEKAEQEAERAAREVASRAEADEWNYRRTVWSQVHGFLPRFYDDRWILNPEWTRPYCGVDRMISNPENPLPEVEWRALQPGDRHGASEFTCEGLTFRCYWKDERRSYGDDRADWDDGWWPMFKLVRVRPRRWPFRDQETEVDVHSPAQVAEAVGR